MRGLVTSPWMFRLNGGLLDWCLYQSQALTDGNMAVALPFLAKSPHLCYLTVLMQCNILVRTTCFERP